MDKPFYEFRIRAEARMFSFVSEGLRPVNKAVIYAETNIDNLYNLALADVEPDGSHNYYSVRNNGDLERIMATVAQTMLVFFQSYPTALVAFTGSRPARTRLYQVVLAREVRAASATLVIQGVKGEIIESFQPNQSYDGFVVSLQPQNIAP